MWLDIFLNYVCLAYLNAIFEFYFSLALKLNKETMKQLMTLELIDFLNKCTTFQLMNTV